jgi:hypothetical protein
MSGRASRALDDVGVHHEPVPVEGAYREQSIMERLGNLVHPVERLLRAAHIDRVTRAIGRLDGRCS